MLLWLRWLSIGLNNLFTITPFEVTKPKVSMNNYMQIMLGVKNKIFVTGVSYSSYGIADSGTVANREDIFSTWLIDGCYL